MFLLFFCTRLAVLPLPTARRPLPAVEPPHPARAPPVVVFRTNKEQTHTQNKHILVFMINWGPLDPNRAIQIIRTSSGEVVCQSYPILPGYHLARPVSNSYRSKTKGKMRNN